MARGVVDLHCHTMLSDGELGPAEFLRRAEVAGLEGVALTDHADSSNLEIVVPALLRACESERRHGVLLCAAGVELTHVRPGEIAELVSRARALGAQFVAVHGESPVEPVAPGTNRAAIEAGCDLLAHPGPIDEDIARLAAARGVPLEVSGKVGHSLANGRVVRSALACGTQLVYGGDTHRPAELRRPDEVRHVLLCAGLSREEADRALARGVEILRRASSVERGA